MLAPLSIRYSIYDYICFNVHVSDRFLVDQNRKASKVLIDNLDSILICMFISDKFTGITMLGWDAFDVMFGKCVIMFSMSSWCM